MDLRPCHRDVVAKLCVDHHGYGSAGKTATYAFAVFEEDRPVAGFLWQPPPPGAARSVCPELPAAVLSLSRMVAVPREERLLRHISKPLKAQMRRLIDWGRWPVLVTYSDEGQGHTGHVYKCSGWKKTIKARRTILTDAQGRRISSYSNGKNRDRVGFVLGSTTIQRWEHWATEGSIAAWMEQAGWKLVPRAGRWRSGNAAFTWEHVGPDALWKEALGLLDK